MSGFSAAPNCNALLFDGEALKTRRRKASSIRDRQRSRERCGHWPASVKEKEKSMNKLELVEHVANATGTSKAAATAALDAVLDGITTALKNGDEVRLVGFGAFSVKESAARTGRNPLTGAEIQIPASKSARFKPGATLKTELNAAG
jgi:DNA-binding protein HU-beta